MNFQRIVIIIAIIVLIITLVFVGVMLYQSKKNEVWPPYLSDCPDYWVDLSSNGVACLNTHRLGKCNIPSKGNPNTMNFNVYPFNDETQGTCNKYKWSKGCGVEWDGITYGVENPCSTSS